MEFESFPEIELTFESLARDHWGIELLNVRHEHDRTQATVFVPDGKLDHFERLIRDYLAEKRDRRGHLRDNQRLIDAIREVRAASLRALWTDSTDVFPATDDGAVWWEVWLPVRRDRRATVAAFRERAEAQDMEVKKGELIFPERTVLMARASVEQMQRSIITLNSIAELRRPKETADFFDSLLQRYRGPLALGIERDLYFGARFPISIYAKAARMAQCIVESGPLLEDAARTAGISAAYTIAAESTDPQDAVRENAVWGMGVQKSAAHIAAAARLPHGDRRNLVLTHSMASATLDSRPRLRAART